MDAVLTEDDINAVVGARVRSELGRQAKPQRWLAGKLGITQAALSQLLSGQSNWSSARLMKAAAVLNVPVGEFYPPMQARPAAPAGAG